MFLCGTGYTVMLPRVVSDLILPLSRYLHDVYFVRRGVRRRARCLGPGLRVVFLVCFCGGGDYSALLAGVWGAAFVYGCSLSLAACIEMLSVGCAPAEMCYFHEVNDVRQVMKTFCRVS